MSKLIADIGATNARFALVENGSIKDINVLPCADYPTLADSAVAYLSMTGGRPETGAFAIAAPLDGTDQVTMINHQWDFSVMDTGKKAGLKHLRVINDFTALAYAVPFLESKYRFQVGGGAVKKEMPVGIIGPGTGLGVAAVVFVDGKPVPITTEGGHVTMPAANKREFELFEFLKSSKYHHVSAERVISGKGLLNIYHAICGVDKLDLPERAPEEITEAALENKCAACVETLDLFCHFLGVAAGNLALTYGAFGGIYIAGGIVQQLGGYFTNSRFRESFLAKGRFSSYLEAIPTFVITHPYPGLEGLKYL